MFQNGSGGNIGFQNGGGFTRFQKGDNVENLFLKIRFRGLSNPSYQPLWSRERKSLLLLQSEEILAVDLGNIHMVLVLSTCRIHEF